MRSLLLGGVLPVVAFTIVEEYFGTIWGLVAGMVLGVGEIISEWWQSGRVDPITWIGNGLLIVMGAISLFTNEGIWFKLQPALIEAATAVLFIGSVFVGTPFLNMMARKQGMLDNVRPELAPTFQRSMKWLTFRIGIFFLLHAAIATWAALYWSTRAWAFLKGIGFTGTMIAYMVVESIILRKRLSRAAQEAFARTQTSTD